MQNLQLLDSHFQNLQGLESCTNLKILQMEHNRLVHFDQSELAYIFHQLSNITYMYLGHKEPHNLDANLLSGMPSLRRVAFTNNDIDRIGKHIFRRNSNLTSINLQHNFIQHVEAKASIFTALKSLRG